MLGVKVLGNVREEEKFLFTLSNGQTVTFHAAYKDRSDPKSVRVFMVGEGLWPSVIANKLGIEYDLMLNATTEQVDEFMSLSEHRIVGVS